MSLIETTLKNFFQQYPNRAILVAYSGGVDSQVLLHALARLKQQNKLTNPLSACHINHGLSENALLWQQAAEQQCAQLSLNLVSCQVSVKPTAQESLEALARDARYEALQTASDDNSLIVTGHHSDDQSETFLLALKRGSGLKGLSAMAQTSSFGSSKHNKLLVRPLLNISRQEIEHYAITHKLVWIEDESNQDTRFDRNFIRHQMMPMLKARWPSVLSTINRSITHCQEGEQLLNEIAQQDLLLCLSGDKCLKVSTLSQFTSARFNNVLRHFLSSQHYLMPSSEQLKQVRSQLLANGDKCPQIKVGECWLRRFKGDLHLTDEFNDVSSWSHELQAQDITASSTTKVNLPDSLGRLKFSFNHDNNDSQHVTEQHVTYREVKQHKILAPKQTQVISIRFSHNNPRCLPDFRTHSRPLKKVLQELSIPPWQRKRIPFLYYDDQFVAALGYFVCKDYLISDTNNRLNILWSENS